MNNLKKALFKIPTSVTVVVLIIVSLISGVMTTKMSFVKSDLITNFTTHMFITMVIVYAVEILMDLIDKLLMKTLKMKIINKTHNQLFEKIAGSKMSEIQQSSTGKIFDAVKDIGVLKASIIPMFIWLIPTVMPFATMTYKIGQKSILGVVVMLACMTGAFTVSMTSKRVAKYSDTEKLIKADLQAKTVDNFMNLKTLKYLGIAGFCLNRQINAQREAEIALVNPVKVIYFRIVDILSVTSVLVNVYIFRHDIGMLTFILMTAYSIDNFRCSLQNILELWIELKSSYKVLDGLDGDDIADLPTLVGDYIIENVKFDYGKDSIEFNIEKIVIPYGERTLITGESGQGKSSLANLIAGGIEPSEGKFDRYKSYYVWQETESLNDTLWNNIVFDNKDNVTEARVLMLFKQLNMTDWFQTLPDGFNTILGERGCKLSSGQKQRLNIIRLCLEMENHPEKVFIMDEITSNLDDLTKDLAIKLIANKSIDRTCIIISHNEGFDEICSNHILVENHRFMRI